MRNFSERISRFMYGRYGMDQLGRFLFILSIVFWAISLILRWTPFRKAYFVFWLLNTIIYIFAFYRILSRDTYRRTVENERYLHFREKMLPFARDGKAEFQKITNPDYVFRKCRFCGAKLRLRRKRGKHTTRCPKCGKTMTVRVLFGKQ
ncbi:MAG: hypothetical protein IJT27_07655 [Clostridia bacterium]|nr:hypothetical protein [Clostridia bacterium]